MVRVCAIPLVSITTNYDDVKTVETNKKVLSQGKFHDNFHDNFHSATAFA